MLVNKPYEKNEVITFKMANGDEIIAAIVSENDTAFVVKNPVVVLNTEKGVGLLGALFTGNMKDHNVPISKSHIMMHVPTTDIASDHYTHTVTGIKPVRANIIV